MYAFGAFPGPWKRETILNVFIMTLYLILIKSRCVILSEIFIVCRGILWSFQDFPVAREMNGLGVLAVAGFTLFTAELQRGVFLSLSVHRFLWIFQNAFNSLQGKKSSFAFSLSLTQLKGGINLLSCIKT